MMRKLKALRKPKRSSNKLKHRKWKTCNHNHRKKKREGSGTVLSKLGKADKAIMKALIKISVIAGGDDEVAKQIDSILSEHAKMKNIIMEQGQEISYQGENQRTSEQSGRSEESRDLPFNSRRRLSKRGNKPSYDLVVTSDNMGKKEVERLIKKKVDPIQLGIRDATMKAGREGVILTTTSKETSTKLQEHIQGKVELKNLQIRTPKENRYHIKVIGIDEDMETDGLETKIIEQNHLQCKETQLC
ncbi:hypothetical protein HPB49_026343 [Dermacentor silvarum]|nr:hypothetical protein HPB49_026343 [Dermacentor silvarum]